MSHGEFPRQSCTSKPARAARFHNWCFTSFDDKPPIFSTLFRYLCYQIEQCPTTGTLHFQGYAEFTNAQSLSQVKGIIGQKAHLEPRKGTQKQAIEYCKKSASAMPDSFSEFGHPAFQGQRSDLDNMWEMARQGFTSCEMLHIFRGNGLRHLGVYQRAQHALFYSDEYTVDTQLLYNRRNHRHPASIANFQTLEAARRLRREHLDELQAQFHPEEIEEAIDSQIMQNNATEVLGNTVSNTSDNGLPPATCGRPPEGGGYIAASAATSLREGPSG